MKHGGMSDLDFLDLDCWLTQVPEYCKPHGEELPCAKCIAQRCIRERDVRLRREHERLPLRHPKVLEVK